MLHLTIDAGKVTRLRSAVVRACGDKLKFLRIEPIARSNEVRCWLCLTGAGIDLAMDAIMRTLSGARFGGITPS
jgi:hypothetical protein